MPTICHSPHEVAIPENTVLTVICGTDVYKRQAQKQVWGADVISAALSPDHVNEIYQALPFTRSAGEFITPKDVYTGVIQKQVTSAERISLLNAITNVAPVALYSASDTSLCPKAAPMGIVSYTAEIPDIFHTTKICLLYTSRCVSETA